MNVFCAHGHRRKVPPTAIGSVLVLLWGLTCEESRAQQVAAPRADVVAPGGAGWYAYDPARGWVSYAPASAPATVQYGTAPGSPGAATAVPVAPAARGWAGYNPGPAWLGYAPASAGTGVVVRPVPGWTLPPAGTMRRRAAHEFVNGNAPSDYARALSSYREMGSGRRVPLAKPWLPPPP